MGTLHYDNRLAIPLDDRALAHLKIVVLTKLRRNESFAFSWENPPSNGSGRHTVWIHPAVSLHFEFLGSRQPEINRAWLEQLAELANRSLGVHITPEPAAADRPDLEI